MEVGPYVVGDELGRGGFGTVYRARHAVLGRDVAIKVLHAEHSQDAVASARFVAEAKSVNTVHHENIVEIFDFGTLPDGRQYFVMELLAGQTLRARLAEQRTLSVDEATPILAQIASALDAVHAAGLTHRDLKPDNIFLTPTGIKLIDFGLVKRADLTLTETNVVMGTPLYMSPEQFRDSANVGPASDRYSFGAVAYQMFTGAPPFEASDAIGLALHVLNDAPVPPCERDPALPPGVDHFCLALLAKDPEARPATLAQALQLLSRTQRRRRWPRYAGALAIVGAVGAVALSRTPAARETPTFAFVSAPVVGAELSPDDRGSVAIAVANLVRTRMRAAPERGFWVSADAGGERVELVTTIAATQVAVEARRDGHPLARGTGSSVDEAVTALAPALVRALTGDRAPAPADARELAGIRDTAAPSVVAFRRYQDTVDDFDRALSVDTAPIIAACDALIAEYPTWGRPYVQLCFLQGFESDACRATAAKARRAADFSRDPLGDALLYASEHPLDRDEDLRRFERAPTSRTDQVGAMILAQLQFSAGRAVESTELLGDLYRAHGELQYGTNYSVALEGAGRTGDLLALARAWSAAHPESSEALVLRARIEVQYGERAAARPALALRRLLLGETPDIWFSLFDAYVAVDDLDSARRVVDKMLAFNDELRARGRYRAGLLAVRQGKLMAAFDAFTLAARENAPLGSRSELTQVLSQQLAIASAAGRAGERERIERERLAAHLDPVDKVAIEYALALLHRTGDACPDRQPLLATLTDPVARQQAQRHMLGTAAAAGCARCQQVFDAGLDEDERDAAYVAQYARCADAIGDRVAAKRTYERVIADRASPDPALFEAMRAKLYLAKLLRAGGDVAGARALAGALVEAWANADRAIPELVEAKALLAP